MKRHGENMITFVNESLYINHSRSTWWIDSGVTIHIANCLQGSVRRGTLKKEKAQSEWLMELKQKLKLPGSSSRASSWFHT